jgi:transporter family-2 protein
MAYLIAVLVTLASGVMLAVQPATNAVLARTSGSVVLAALTSFAVGTAILVAVWIVADRTSPATLRGMPAWAWLGGAYGAVYVAAAAFAAPRLGVAPMLTIAIASQLLAALLIDHLGWFGVPVAPVSVIKLAGLVMVIGGVLLVRR